SLGVLVRPPSWQFRHSHARMPLRAASLSTSSASWLGSRRRAGTITKRGARSQIKTQDPPRAEGVVSPQAVSESASAALRSAEVVAAPVVSADFLAASAFPAAVPLLPP